MNSFEDIGTSYRDMIRTYRKKNRLSTRKVAKLTGCSQSLVSQFECGVELVSPAKAFALARAIGADPVEILLQVLAQRAKDDDYRSALHRLALLHRNDLATRAQE